MNMEDSFVYLNLFLHRSSLLTFDKVCHLDVGRVQLYMDSYIQELFPHFLPGDPTFQMPAFC